MAEMLKLIHKIYRKDKVTLDLIKALAVKLISSENKINDLYKQIFLNYADWYLELKEKEMSITKKAADITERRNYVKTRLLGVGTAAKEMLESTINSVSGVTAVISFKDMTVHMDFKFAENNRLITFSKNTLAEIIPYHLDFDISYKHIKWEEPKRVTWGKVKAYTWGEIKESVEGTLEKGLDGVF